MMLFGEKYPDVVRMVSMGEFSKELCGGTHVSNTGQVGLIHIVGEESVSAGTRRVTAVTGREALARLRSAEQMLAETATALRVPVSEIPARVASMMKELRELKKRQTTTGRPAELSPERLLSEASHSGDVTIVVAEAPGADAQSMRQIIDQLRKQAGPVAVLLGSRETDKVTLVAGISHELQERGLSAGTWIRSAADVVGGRGGDGPIWPRPAADIPRNYWPRWMPLGNPSQNASSKKS